MRIFISDVNDNKPIFTKSVYEVNVEEDQDVGSTVTTVSANDEDEGKSFGIPSGGTWNINELIFPEHRDRLVAAPGRGKRVFYLSTFRFELDRCWATPLQSPHEALGQITIYFRHIKQS